MFSPKKRLDTPNDYEFPFPPYKIQKELMEAVYDTLTQKSIGIFESPTGTGKSLTLTCSVLKWVEDREVIYFIKYCCFQLIVILRAWSEKNWRNAFLIWT